MGIVTSGSLTIVDVNDGKDGVDGLPGPALSINATAQGFTFLDGVASPAQQYIGFSVVRYGTTDPVQWYASNNATLITDTGLLPMEHYLTGLYGSGEGDVAYMSIDQFGSAKQVVITAVAAGLTATAVIMRIGDTTAAAGATVGAPPGTNVGSTPAETVESNAANALAAANAALADKLDKASSDILNIATSGTVYQAGIRVGSLLWDANGVRTSGKGLALTPNGVLGHNGTNVTFAIDAVTGDATFSGALSAATGSFAGSLSAATGTFSGNLSAAGGSFAGSLSAATGTFSGALTASAINAVDTINIAGNAVTIPVSAYTAAETADILEGSVQSVSFTSSGGPVFITCSVKCTNDNDISSMVYIKRDGSPLIYSYVGKGGVADLPINLCITDTPGAGAHTYTIHISSSGYGIRASKRSLFALETKR